MMSSKTKQICVLLFASLQLALLSANSLAQTKTPILISPGIYTGNGITVVVREVPGAPVVHIRADGEIDGVIEFADFYLSLPKGIAFISPYGDSPVRSSLESLLKTRGQLYQLQYDALDESGKTRVLAFQLGGFTDARDFEIELAIDLSSQRLTALRSVRKIAKWSLPNGWHSGPMKYLSSQLRCDGLLLGLNDAN